jgi:cytidine deaminase
MEEKNGFCGPQKTTDPVVAQLIGRAYEACKNSYSPYSNFPVGAALLCDDDTIYTGLTSKKRSFLLIPFNINFDLHW